MNVKALLKDFDGRRTASLSEVGQQLPATSETVVTLLEATQKSKGGAIEVGATWLAKYLFDDGLVVDEKVTRQLIDTLATAHEGDSKLHLLQSLPATPLTQELSQDLLAIADDILETSDYKFARAWAYNALGLAGEQLPKRRKRIAARLEQALEEESASVKVRIRKALIRIDA